MVVDASVAVKWVVAEPGSDQARALIAPDRCIAPDLVVAEVANALWAKVRRAELRGVPSLDPFLLRLFRRLAPMPELADAALNLALDLGHPAYDCFYLALAIEADEPLVTADTRFLDALRGSPHAARVLALGEVRP
jgi:predicted nucleic acid-binding protein